MTILAKGKSLHTVKADVVVAALLAIEVSLLDYDRLPAQIAEQVQV